MNQARGAQQPRSNRGGQSSQSNASQAKHVGLTQRQLVGSEAAYKDGIQGGIQKVKLP